MSLRNHIVNIKASKTDYEKLKTKINRTTISYGATLTSAYFITQGAAEGVSATLGVVSSVAYINLLSHQVDNIEKSSRFQKQLLVPVGTAIFETVWNHAPFGFDFDYGATLMGFLAYKVALFTVVYDEVRKMLLDVAADGKEQDPVIPGKNGDQ